MNTSIITLLTLPLAGTPASGALLERATGLRSASPPLVVAGLSEGCWPLETLRITHGPGLRRLAVTSDRIASPTQDAARDGGPAALDLRRRALASGAVTRELGDRAAELPRHSC